MFSFNIMIILYFREFSKISVNLMKTLHITKTVFQFYETTQIKFKRFSLYDIIAGEMHSYILHIFIYTCFSNYRFDDDFVVVAYVISVHSMSDNDNRVRFSV